MKSSLLSQLLEAAVVTAAFFAEPLAQAQLINTSVRVQVGSGANILITGFAVGATPKTYLFRAVGPTLSVFGLTGLLADPTLSLFSGSTVIQSNDDWGTNASAISAAGPAAGAFALSVGSKDSALIATLTQGTYTVQISGVGGGTGLALFEAYEIPTPAAATTGTLRGLVRDGSNSTVLSGVSLTFTSATGAALGGTTTGSTGEFSVTLPAGAITATVSLSGYVNTILNATVTANATVQSDSVLFARNQPGNGTVSGRIANALTGAGLSGATLRFRSGVQATTGTVLATATTDSSGNYAVLLVSGTYTCEISFTNFVTTYFVCVAVGGSTIASQNSSISPVLAGSDLRIVLTWGATPSDLDSHFTGPTAGSATRFHVYWVSKSATGVNLDVDDTSSFGPETITLTQFNSGTYRYSVHDYSNRSSASSTALSSSGAQVKVFQGSTQLATFNVPTGNTGTLWTVFEMDGASRTITPKNIFSNVSDYSTIQSLPGDRTPVAVGDDTDAALIAREPQVKQPR